MCCRTNPVARGSSYNEWMNERLRKPPSSSSILWNRQWLTKPPSDFQMSAFHIVCSSHLTTFILRYASKRYWSFLLYIERVPANSGNVVLVVAEVPQVGDSINTQHPTPTRVTLIIFFVVWTFHGAKKKSHCCYAVSIELKLTIWQLLDGLYKAQEEEDEQEIREYFSPR